MEYYKDFIGRFIHFETKDWDNIKHLFQERALSKGIIYLQQGKICKQIGFVKEGAFIQFRTEDVDRYAFDFSFKDDYVVDYTSFLSGKPSSIGIEAIKDSVVIEITKSDLEEAYRISPVFLDFGRRMVERAFVWDDERIQSLLYETAEERYLKLVETNKELLSEIPLNQLSPYLGIRPETLSRIRSRMAKGNRS